jgi:hypothetical protein
MERLLLRTRTHIDDCEKHLAKSGAFGTEIESYLTQYLVVILCADIQQEIYQLSERRAQIANDADITGYVSISARKILRSVGKGEIAKFVGMFGANQQKTLNASVNEVDVAKYNNAVTERHDVAHNNGSQITFRELKDAVEAAERILIATAKALSLQ